MSLVDTDTGEVVVLMDRGEAERITADIKAWAGTLWQKIEQAHRGQAWRALGYESWGAYLEAEFDISRSRGYQLVAHARAVRQLAEAAGIDPGVHIVDTREGHTRAIDTEAAAAEIADEVDALPDDATDEDRAEVVERVTRSHYERTKTAPSGDGPAATPPAADEGDDGAGDADTPHAAPAPSPADASPSPGASAGTEDATTLADLYPDETYRINAGKARGRAYSALAGLDPATAAEREDVEGRDAWLALAKTLRNKADAIEAAMSSIPTLRSVQ